MRGGLFLYLNGLVRPNAAIRSCLGEAQQIQRRRLQRQFKAFPVSGRLVITGMTVLSVIQRAYGLQQFELVHDNNPVLDQRIDIQAKAAGPASPAQM